ncbi:MAG: PIN domain-containing protein [Leptolyngbyaceae cyanobacterium RM2_2_4]|nr:PIN domain-containing protein [Leptolyngbyaceae cyanobacterium RM2_2_4]
MIIADTGFFIALFNARDDYHQAAKSLLYRIAEPLITTHAVIHETYYLLGARGRGMRQQIEFLIDIAESAFQVFALQPHHFQRIAHLLQQYADLPMDYADASLVVLAEHLGSRIK